MTLRFINHNTKIPSTNFIKEATNISIDGKSLEEIKADDRAQTIDEAIGRIKKMHETCQNNDHDCDRCEYTKHSYHETCVEYVLRCMK